MISFLIFGPLAVVSWLLQAWVLAIGARKAGSARGQFRWAFLALVLQTVVASLLVAMELLFGGMNVVFMRGIAELVVLGACLFILRKVFRLSYWRALIPFGCLLAYNLIIVTVILLTVWPYLCEAYVMPTASMSPTVDADDLFFVEKITMPHRWDVVVFWHKVSDGHSIVFCKRLIGMPGERLRFDQGTLYVNDEPMTPPAVLAGRLHAQVPGSSGLYYDGETITLDSNQVFFVGDNLDRSADSRLYGPEDRKAIIGIADLRYWPLSRVGLIH